MHASRFPVVAAYDSADFGSVVDVHLSRLRRALVAEHTRIAAEGNNRNAVPEEAREPQGPALDDPGLSTDEDALSRPRVPMGGVIPVMVPKLPGGKLEGDEKLDPMCAEPMVIESSRKAPAVSLRGFSRGSLSECSRASSKETSSRWAVQQELSKQTAGSHLQRPCFGTPGGSGGSLRDKVSIAIEQGGIGGRMEVIVDEPIVMHQGSPFVMLPNCIFRNIVEVIGVLFLLYDAIMVPLIIGWDPEPRELFKWINVGTLAFWLLEMVLNCFTAFYLQGEPVTDLHKVIKHYLMTWFFADLLINTFDFVSVLMEFVMGMGDDAFNAFYLRVLRLLKSGRMVRIVAVLKRAAQHRSVTFQLQFLSLGTKLVVTLLWLNHVICCFWYAIGDSAISDTGMSWLDLRSPSGLTRYKDAGFLYQYFTSLHWSMTQMTPGSMAVTPQNSWERLFNVLCLFVGLFVGALLVSQLSAKMVKVQLDTQEMTIRMANLRTFLQENQISWSLRHRVEHQIAERSISRKRLREKDVELLKTLSTSLRKELSCSVFAKLLMSHILFRCWAVTESPLIEAICYEAVELLCLSKDDELFTSLTVAEKMYLVLQGFLVYHATDRSKSRVSVISQTGRAETPPAPEDGELVREGTWVSEVALWTEWTYSGTLRALGAVELVCVHVPAVLDLLKKRPAVRSLNHHYCQAFCAQLVDRDNAQLVETCFDVEVNVDEVLMAMSRDWRLMIMQPLLMEQRSWVQLFPHKSPEHLIKELAAGKCIISLAPDGRVQRTVLLVALNVKRANGEVLVRLAKVIDGKPVVSLALPGTKMIEAERADQAAKRVLESELAEFNPHIGFFSQKKTSDVTSSATYGMPTKYVKTTFYGRLHTDADSDVNHSASPSEASEKTFGVVNTRPSDGLFLRLASNILAVRTATSSGDLVPKVSTPGVAFMESVEILTVVDSEGQQVLYAWLPPDHGRILGTARVKEELQVWLLNRWKPPVCMPAST